MNELLEKSFLVIFGGLVGSLITTRFEKLRAWKAHSLVKLEIDRNLDILKEINDHVFAKQHKRQTGQKLQIEKMLNSSEGIIPTTVHNLVQQPLPKWSYKGWESQISFMALVLRDEQVKRVFDLQVLLEKILMLHDKIANLVRTYGDNGKKLTVDLLSEWQNYTDSVLEIGNPLKDVRSIDKWLSILGIK